MILNLPEHEFNYLVKRLVASSPSNREIFFGVICPCCSTPPTRKAYAQGNALYVHRNSEADRSDGSCYAYRFRDAIYKIENAEGVAQG